VRGAGRGRASAGGEGARRLPESDAALVRRCRAGDAEAFDTLVRRYQRQTVNLAYRLLGDLDAAHDVAQEAFVCAYRALGKFRGAARFSTWLYRIVYNLCLDELNRRRRRSAEHSLDNFYAADDSPMLDVPDPNPDPAEEVAVRLLQREIRRAVARLSPTHRAVLVMYDLQGLSYEEIAEVLRCPLGTVKSRLSRARLALRAELAGKLEQFAPRGGRSDLGER